MSRATEREANAARAQWKRAERRAKKLCINSDHHGKATHGSLCKRCREAHSGTVTGTSAEPLWRLLQRMARKIVINTKRSA